MQFVTQFARAVYLQWSHSLEHAKFWDDHAFLHAMLEEAVAKLPDGKLKAQLAHDLEPLVTRLASSLRELHVRERLHEKEQSFNVPLNEIGTEIALTQAATAPVGDKKRKLADVLALDTDITLMNNQNYDAKQLVQRFALIAARRYESPKEQQHKRGFVLRRLAACVQQQMASWPCNWCCSKESDGWKEVQELRVLLESIARQDVVALASISYWKEEKDRDSLMAPWTKFYRPDESNELTQVVYEDEIAKIYGALLTLAIDFPIVNKNLKEATSSESSDDEVSGVYRESKLKLLEPGTQAQETTRQVLFAAQLRQREGYKNRQWLVSVLSFRHRVLTLKTNTFKLEGTNSDELDRRAMLECLGHVYSRTFANVALFDQVKQNLSVEKSAEQDLALFEAVVCLRYAATFMRVERKSSLPALTTAMAHLAGIPVPLSFMTWLEHEQVSHPVSVLEKATQRLWTKCCGQNRMMNILLSSTNVTTEALSLIQTSYEDFVRQLAKGHFPKSPSVVDIEALAASVQEATSDLFYVDTGGNEDKERGKTKKKKSFKKKKQRNNKKNVAVANSKRS